MITEKEKIPAEGISNRTAHGCAFAIVFNCVILFMFFGLNFIYSQYSEYLPFATEIINKARNADRHSVEQTKKELLIILPALLFVVITYAGSYYGIKSINKVFGKSKQYK